MGKSIKMYSEETGYFYRRYPEARLRNSRVYWVRTKPGGGARYLHQDLWEKHNGPIPDRFHIHHIDHNPLNNDISNLDCINPSEHLSYHQDNLTPERQARRKEHIDAIRPLASAWHRSTEGRAWHRELGRMAWDLKEPVKCHCDHCGTEYETLVPHHGRFCSNACKTKARYRSGVDDVAKQCVQCGKVRTGNRYKLSDFCNRWCRQRYDEAIAVPTMA